VEPGGQFRGFRGAAVAAVVARHRPVAVPVRATAAQQQQGTEELLQLDERRRQGAENVSGETGMSVAPAGAAAPAADCLVRRRRRRPRHWRWCYIRPTVVF